MAPQRTNVPQGTLDMLILKALALEPMHGYGVSKRLDQLTSGRFRLNPGSFFPALYRMEEEGWIAGSWARSENNRRARFYRLTRSGRRRLERATREWEQTSQAIRHVLQAGQEA